MLIDINVFFYIVLFFKKVLVNESEDNLLGFFIGIRFFRAFLFPFKKFESMLVLFHDLLVMSEVVIESCLLLLSQRHSKFKGFKLFLFLRHIILGFLRV